jgi:hypothetical protein
MVMPGIVAGSSSGEVAVRSLRAFFWAPSVIVTHVTSVAVSTLDSVTTEMLVSTTVSQTVLPATLTTSVVYSVVYSVVL